MNYQILTTQINFSFLLIIHIIIIIQVVVVIKPVLILFKNFHFNLYPINYINQIIIIIIVFINYCLISANFLNYLYQS